MRQLLAKLLDDLGVSQEGLFSTHAEKASHPENVHFDPESFAREEENRRKEWTATDALQVEQDANNTVGLLPMVFLHLLRDGMTPFFIICKQQIE